MRLPKTHYNTSERRDDEADKERQKKGKERRPIRKGQEKRQGKPPPYHLKRGAEQKRVVGKAKTEAATTLASGGEAKYTTEKEKTKSHTVLRHSRSGRSTQIAPGPDGEWIGRTKKKRTQKAVSLVPQCSPPITQTTARD